MACHGIAKAGRATHQTCRGSIANHMNPNIGKIPLEKLAFLELQKRCKKLLASSSFMGPKKFS